MMTYPDDAPTAVTPLSHRGTYGQELDREREGNREWERAYRRERRIAESLQRVLLRSFPWPALPGIAVEAFYESALEEATVGGDSFDTFALSGNRIALVVADASGKGLAAAERVAEIRFSVRAFLREHTDLGYALSCLNDFVCASHLLGGRDDATFATLTLVVLDCASGEAACLCAGGEPPLVLRAGGGVEVVQICGPALGLFPGLGYSVAPISLAAGDTVLLVTDGLTEARLLTPGGPSGSRSGAFLGLEGLARLVVEALGIQTQSLSVPDPPVSLCRFGRSVFEGARAFAGGTFHDDACLLIGRRPARE